MMPACLSSKAHGRTVSSLPAVKIRSVVAATLPPFRDKSHMISRLGTCGNIAATCSTCCAFTGLVPDRGAESEGEEKK